MAKTLNISGQDFGRWKVLGFSHMKGRRRYWRCLCECGKIALVLQDNLTRGLSRSCGCLNRELSRERGLRRTGSNNPNWNGGNKRDHKGYVMVFMPSHPFANANGYIQEHRLVVERALGRPLRKEECVHHVDGDKANNKNSNLVLCNDWGYHQTLHRRDRALRSCGNPEWRKCSFCKEYDDPSRMAAGINESYYHLRCSAEYQSARKQ